MFENQMTKRAIEKNEELKYFTIFMIATDIIM